MYTDIYIHLFTRHIPHIKPALFPVSIRVRPMRPNSAELLDRCWSMAVCLGNETVS